MHIELGWEQALGFLERLARNRVYQPDTGPGVIQVMGLLEAEQSAQIQRLIGDQ